MIGGRESGEQKERGGGRECGEQKERGWVHEDERQWEKSSIGENGKWTGALGALLTSKKRVELFPLLSFFSM
jgi:hypothetical protein